MIDYIVSYYNKISDAFGFTPQGVGWSSKHHQEARFEQICKVIGDDKHFSILDYGCGHGELLDYMNEHKYSGEYIGFDISPRMLEAASQKHPYYRFTVFPVEADYVVASGTFNIKFKISDFMWERYVFGEVMDMYNMSRKGIAFNLLCKSDFDEIYHTDPEYFAAVCRPLGNVELIQGYLDDDFTIIVRKYA